MYRKLTPDEVEQIERRLLIEMAQRYGALYDHAAREREEKTANAIKRAKAAAGGEKIA